MSKQSIITVFISVTLVVIVAELLVNDYLTYPNLEADLAANVINSEEEVVLKPVASDVTSTATDSESEINFTILQNAGFINMTLQRVPFNGFLFETIDLRDFEVVQIVEHNLLYNNKLKAGAFYEFNAGTAMLAVQIFDFLREKSATLEEQALAKINQTDQFGESSFYINFLDQKEDVFLVVKIQDNVYALTYKKEYHPLIKQLLTLLS